MEQFVYVHVIFQFTSSYNPESRNRHPNNDCSNGRCNDYINRGTNTAMCLIRDIAARVGYD